MTEVDDVVDLNDDAKVDINDALSDLQLQDDSDATEIYDVVNEPYIVGTTFVPSIAVLESLIATMQHTNKNKGKNRQKISQQKTSKLISFRIQDYCTIQSHGDYLFDDGKLVEFELDDRLTKTQSEFF